MGSIPARLLGFSSRRSRELAWIQGWERVAGKTLSRHVRVLGVDRHVLRVEARDRAWYDAVEPLLPQLAARIAVEHPRLGIEKFALHLAGGTAGAEPRAVPDFVPGPAGEGCADASRSPAAHRRSPPTSPAQPMTAEDRQRRLERAARRYVRRSGSETRPPQKA